MTKRIFLSAVIAFALFACSGLDGEDPTNSDLVSSSSKLKLSSSSSKPSSSSSIARSSNSEELSSSSEIVQSSSSGKPSSSSLKSSSSSIARSSSSILNSSSAVRQSSTSNSSGSGVSGSGSSSSATSLFDNIKYWVGTGSNKAVLIVQWNDGKSPTALAWGFKWEAGETKYGYDMIDSIAKYDQRFFYLFKVTDLGIAIAGMGFDASGKTTQLKDRDGDCESLYKGSAEAGKYADFDYWGVCGDFGARWGSGWYNAYWSYWVSDNINSEWNYSGLGASSRELENGSVDAWYFDKNMSTNDPECMEGKTACNGKNLFGTIVPVQISSINNVGGML